MVSGLTFEDSGSLLRWGARLTEIATIDNPEITKLNGNIRIGWRDKVLLNGLKCNPIIEIPDYESLDNSSFKSIKVSYGGNDTAIRATFHEFHEHISKYFGAPYQIDNDVEEERESSRWRIEGIEILLTTFRLHGLICSLVISKNAE